MISLRCDDVLGNPKPRVQWYSANGKVTSSFTTGIDFMGGKQFENESENEDSTTQKLVINQLDRSHANSTYTCLAGNDETVESNLFMTVLINMYCKYKIIILLRNSLQVHRT